jgi:transcriptional regulator with XRE-family HTH domain
MTLGKRLQHLMDMKKINQVDAARGIGIDRSRFNLLLNDKVDLPRRETFIKISHFFGCNIEWLITGTGDEFPANGDHESGIGRVNSGINSQIVAENELQEPETKMVRMYRQLAEMDADTLGEIQTWLNDKERLRPGFTGWFRLEFQNRFPEFDEWKRNTTKKQQCG